jgi:hypothetical protein
MPKSLLVSSPATPRIYTSMIRLNVLQGYFTTGHRMTEEELAAVQGRSWEELVAQLSDCEHLEN